MRLTCPNCDAQYEVPAEVVPTAGRDVQCSNCGKTWFQYHPDHPREEADDFDASEELSPTEPAADDEVAPAAPRAGPDAPEPARRQLDPKVADILRQEAEVEYEARRRRQAQSLESQPDLGLEAAEVAKPAPAEVANEAEQRRADEAKEHTARLRGEPDMSSEAAASAAAMASRRELLPDIDEINSTLRNDAKPRRLDAETREEIGAGGERKGRSGFRRGVFTILFLFAVMVLIYVFADEIAAAVPAIEINLQVYVDWVDRLRLSLDTQLKSLLGTLDTIANESSN